MTKSKDKQFCRHFGNQVQVSSVTTNTWEAEKSTDFQQLIEFELLEKQKTKNCNSHQHDWKQSFSMLNTICLVCIRGHSSLMRTKYHQN